MKILCFLLVSILTLGSFARPLYASAINVSSVAPVDVTQQIRGRSPAYTLDLPLAWRRHLVGERERFSNPTAIVERLVFKYRPSNPAIPPALFLEVAVFIRTEWRESLGYTRLTETDDHVFAIRAAASNPFVFGADRLIFDNMLRDASNPAFMLSYISVPLSGETVIRNTVSVNGKRMSAPSITSAFRVVSVPLREVSEALGYIVVWDENTQNITISSETFSTTLGTDARVTWRHNITNVNGISYVPTMFFLQALQSNVEIDEHSNVRITRDERG